MKVVSATQLQSPEDDPNSGIPVQATSLALSAVARVRVGHIP